MTLVPVLIEQFIHTQWYMIYGISHAPYASDFMIIYHIIHMVKNKIVTYVSVLNGVFDVERRLWMKV